MGRAGFGLPCKRTHSARRGGNRGGAPTPRPPPRRRGIPVARAPAPLDLVGADLIAREVLPFVPETGGRPVGHPGCGARAVSRLQLLHENPAVLVVFARSRVGPNSTSWLWERRGTRFKGGRQEWPHRQPPPFPISGACGNGCSRRRPPDNGGSNRRELRACARAVDAGITRTDVALDGRPVPVNEVESGRLRLNLPADNIFGGPAGTGPLSVAHGWVAPCPPITTHRSAMPTMRPALLVVPEGTCA